VLPAPEANGSHSYLENRLQEFIPLPVSSPFIVTGLQSANIHKRITLALTNVYHNLLGVDAAG
jgi:hypothetical protein